MRVVFWNIRAGGGKRVGRIARQLEGWAPDAVALCEFRATPPSVEETRHIEAKMTDLAARVKTLAPKAVDPDLLADVDI